MRPLGDYWYVCMTVLLRLSSACASLLIHCGWSVQVIHDFAQCDHEKINNPSGYLMGMLRKYTDTTLPHATRTRSRGGPAAGGAAPLRGSGGGVAAAKGGGRGAFGGDPALPPVRHSAGTHRSSSSQLNAGFTPRGGAGGGLPPTPRAEEYSGERRSPERSRDRSDCDRDRTSDRERERSYSGRCRSRSDRYAHLRPPHKTVTTVVITRFRASSPSPIALPLPPPHPFVCFVLYCSNFPQCMGWMFVLCVVADGLYTPH